MCEMSVTGAGVLWTVILAEEQ